MGLGIYLRKNTVTDITTCNDDDDDDDDDAAAADDDDDDDEMMMNIAKMIMVKLTEG